MENKGLINKIIPFSNVDGPGNRYAIFFQGCNMNCFYCHNPETINLCNHCMACVVDCPTHALKKENGKVTFDEGLCTSCGACVYHCHHSASPKAQFYTIKQLEEQIRSYRSFIRGVTVSGGEPTLQKDFLVQLFKAVKAMGLTCFVDTNGFFDRQACQDLIHITDRFMIDIKSKNKLGILCGINKSHRHLDNLRYLLKMDKVFEVRTVIVKGMDEEETIKVVSEILKDYPNILYRLIKVHTNGLTKRQKKKLKGKIPQDREIFDLVELAKKYGATKVKYSL